MYTKIGYRWDNELKVNRIRYYRHFHSGIQVNCLENEIIVPTDQLPEWFDRKYPECEVVDGKVLWSPALYHYFHHREHNTQPE